MECGVNNPAKHISPKNRQFVAHWPLVRKFGFCQSFYPEVLGSAGHLDCLPGSSSFSFEVFADAKVADSTTLADPLSKNMEIFR